LTKLFLYYQCLQLLALSVAAFFKENGVASWIVSSYHYTAAQTGILLAFAVVYFSFNVPPPLNRPMPVAKPQLEIEVPPQQ